MTRQEALSNRQAAREIAANPPSFSLESALQKIGMSLDEWNALDDLPKSESPARPKVPVISLVHQALKAARIKLLPTNPPEGVTNEQKALDEGGDTPQAAVDEKKARPTTSPTPTPPLKSASSSPSPPTTDPATRSSTYPAPEEWLGANEPDGEEFLGTHEGGEPPR